MHLSGTVRDECRPVVAKLGAYVRGGLAKRDAATVAAHLDQCAECRRVFAELGDVDVALKGIVAPIVLGPAAAYLASAAGKGSAGAWIAGRLGWFRHAPKGQAAAAGVTVAAVAGLAAAALALTGRSGPAPGPAVSFPAAAAPYLVGVITAAAPSGHSRPRQPTPQPPTHGTPAHPARRVRVSRE